MATDLRVRANHNRDVSATSLTRNTACTSVYFAKISWIRIMAASLVSEVLLTVKVAYQS